jgi:N6-L-threonylcarbamoyladenine synthase
MHPEPANKNISVLAIETSCDDTSVAVLRDGVLLSNITASQQVHTEYGGVVPELASRSHQQDIVPVAHKALKEAGIKAADLAAIAYTRGPGLMGSLLVGSSFAKGLSIATGKPLVEVNHLRGHVLANFIKTSAGSPVPNFPFLCLLVSGGHTQIVKAASPSEMEVIGSTIDDAAGEAFDKCAKVMGLPYPGGPFVDMHAQRGNPDAFVFAKPRIPGLNFSFSGLKTSFLYQLRDRHMDNPGFVKDNIDDLCASLQKTICGILIEKLAAASKQTKIKEIVIGGGVAANSGLRAALEAQGAKRGWKTHLPERRFTTDNAAMIAAAAYFQILEGKISALTDVPLARYKI